MQNKRADLVIIFVKNVDDDRPKWCQRLQIGISEDLDLKHAFKIMNEIAQGVCLGRIPLSREPIDQMVAERDRLRAELSTDPRDHDAKEAGVPHEGSDASDVGEEEVDENGESEALENDGGDDDLEG